MLSSVKRGAFFFYACYHHRLPFRRGSLCLLHHAFEWVMELGNLVATIGEVKSHKPDGKDSSGNGSCRPWA